MEAAGLGLFMLAAAAMATLLEHPASPLRASIADPFQRRMLMGLAMGTTAIVLIYSPWGRRSGAHLNPSVTLTFFRLGKMRARDAAGYVGAQFAGGVAGTALAAALLAPWIADPSVNYVATVPGPAGAGVAFGGELLISFVLMTVVLIASNAPTLSRFTGIAAGLLIAAFITFEAPLSGTSMNPARTFGPSLIGGVSAGLWAYLVAPPIGMLAAAELFLRVNGWRAVHCATLHHHRGPCRFCAASGRA